MDLDPCCYPRNIILVGMCLSLVHLLQTFMTSTDIDGKCSKQTEQHEDSNLRSLSWNAQIFLMKVGSLNEGMSQLNGSEDCAKA